MLRHSRYVASIRLGSSTLCGLLTRLGSFRLPLLCIDESLTCWAALRFARRCEKRIRRMVRSKMGRFLPTWYSQTMEKVCNKQWGILWTKHFLSFSRIYRFFWKKLAFYICRPGITYQFLSRTTNESDLHSKPIQACPQIEETAKLTMWVRWRHEFRR